MSDHSTVTCFKVVTRTNDDRLVSAYADALPQSLVVEYIIGQPAQPTTGKLFAFTTKEDAEQLALTILDWIPEVYEARATSTRPIKKVLSLNAQKKDFEDFWFVGPYVSHLHRMAPPNTIVADTITLIKRIA